MSFYKNALGIFPGDITMLVLNLPIKVISEANNRDAGYLKRKRRRAQQEEVYYELHAAIGNKKVQLPCTVNLVRIGQKALDTDNLAGAFKGIRDQIATKLGVDDGEIDKIKFTYDQEPCMKRQYSIRIEITSQEKQL